MTTSRTSQELPSRDPIVLADLVATGRYALEAIAGEPADLDHFDRIGLRDAVIGLLRPRAEVAAHEERLTRLDPDVGIAVCLAGIDDPAAAVAELQGKSKTEPEWSVADGHLFVRGVDQATIEIALAATRPAPVAS